MSYLVLARKFRPQTFLEVSGQDHVTRTLLNAIKRDRIAHAYLFAGPRGVGKTSVARIFSKALNCGDGPTSTPCGSCINCREITLGSNLAVREIDGASHNSVENVRELIESFRALPAPGSRYKIYIIDEVHMLSVAAFNALLKSLEEPPPHTVFILATTEAHKIPDTVISRCQRHDFRALSEREIIERLKTIAEVESIVIDPEALHMVARLAEGSMRDAQSLLERVRAFCESTISASEVSQVLGTVERAVLFQLSAAIVRRDAGECLRLVHEVFSTGIDPGLLLRDFVAHFRDLLFLRFSAGAEVSELLALNEGDRQELLRQARMISEREAQDLLQLAREGADAALRSAYPKYSLEALVVRMATREPMPAATEHSDKVPKSRPVQPQQTTSSAAPPAEMSWIDFVRRVADSGARMLAEQLKRLRIETFRAGELMARGPDFSVAYLIEDENRRKLDQLLKEYSTVERWHVRFTKTGNVSETESGSLVQQEEHERKVTRVEREQGIVNHPKIRSIQKAFPGSKIETIRMKDEGIR